MYSKLPQDLIYFGNNWRIKGKDTPSVVYRYMHQEFIDLFFDEGIIKLSSFLSNRIIEGDIRQDTKEGYHRYRILSRDRKHVVEMHMRDYDSRRMLCCSKELNLDFFLPYFNVNGCFEISNTIGFAFEIAKSLNCFESGQEGDDVYTDNDFTYFPLENHKDLPDLQPFTGEMYKMIPYVDKIGRNDLNPFFQKRKIFESEKEFRIIWKCQVDHDLYIKSPGARKFCRKIS